MSMRVGLSVVDHSLREDGAAPLPCAMTGLGTPFRCRDTRVANPESFPWSCRDPFACVTGHLAQPAMARPLVVTAGRVFVPDRENRQRKPTKNWCIAAYEISIGHTGCVGRRRNSVTHSDLQNILHKQSNSRPYKLDETRPPRQPRKQQNERDPILPSCYLNVFQIPPQYKMSRHSVDITIFSKFERIIDKIDRPLESF